MKKEYPRKRHFLLLAAALLAACGTTPPAGSRYDFGPVPAAAAAPAQAAEMPPGVVVVAPVWLDSPSVLYRLAYDDETQLHAYAQTQWVAAPSRLLEQALASASAASAPRSCGDASATPARIEVNLEEFSQDFDSPRESHVVLRARVRVLAARTHALLAQRQFDLRAPASSPDGPGAVHGLGGLARGFAAAATAWAGSCPAELSATAPLRQQGLAPGGN